jgi:hypothetical protein
MALVASIKWEDDDGFDHLLRLPWCGFGRI